MARTVSIAFLVLAVSACSGDKDEKPEPTSGAVGGSAPKAKADSKPKSNVKKIVTTVPPNKKVACTDLLPDISKFKELVAEDIADTLVDEGKTSPASALCRFMRAGEPPKNAKGENQKLGVLPGDEYCTVKLFCSLATDEGDFKDNCEKDAKKEAASGSRTVYEGNTELGQFACVRKTDRPPSDYAYTYRTIDKDTRCIVEVMGGPSVVDEQLVQNCARAAIQTIGPDDLQKFN